MSDGLIVLIALGVVVLICSIAGMVMNYASINRQIRTLNEIEKRAKEAARLHARECCTICPPKEKRDDA